MKLLKIFRNQLGDMRHSEAGAVLFRAAPDMQNAAGASPAHHSLRAGCGYAVQLLAQQLLRKVRKFRRIGSAEPATDLLFSRRNVPGSRSDKLPGSGMHIKPPAQMAGSMVGHGFGAASEVLRIRQAFQGQTY